MSEINDLKWPKRLMVIRHGQSEQNVALDLLQDNLNELLQKPKEKRDADIELTDIGYEQAIKTGKYLSTTPRFDICFSSPYKRALQTAEAIISMLGYQIKIYKDNRLREKEFGRLHGFTTEEIRENYPEEFNDRERDGKYWYRLPRGENYPDVEIRAHSFLAKLARDYGGKSVLVIAHYVPYIMFRALFEHLDEKDVLNLESIPNCGIQEYYIDTSKVLEGRMKLKEFNKVVY